MPWDSDKSTATDPDNPTADEQLTADEWDAMVADQKGHSARHEKGGSDELTTFGDTTHDALYSPSKAADAVVRTDGTTYFADGEGGSISSGTDAATVLQAALDDLAAADNRDNATLFVAKGVYSLGGTVDVREGVKMVLSEGAYLVPTTDANLLNILPDGEVHGGVLDCRENGAVSAFSSDAVHIEGTDGGAVNFDGRNDTRVQDLFIKLPDGTGKGVVLNASSQADMHVTWVTVSGIAVFRGADAIFLNTQNPANGSTWVNANRIQDISIYQSNYGIRASGTSGNEITGNTISGIMMQPDANSASFVEFAGTCNFNQFKNMFYWDWGIASSTTAVVLDGNTRGNQYEGNLYFDDVQDNGTNMVNGQSYAGTVPGSSAKWQNNEAVAYNLGVTIWDTSTTPNTPYISGPDGTYQPIN